MTVTFGVLPPEFWVNELETAEKVPPLSIAQLRSPVSAKKRRMIPTRLRKGLSREVPRFGSREGLPKLPEN